MIQTKPLKSNPSKPANAFRHLIGATIFCACTLTFAPMTQAGYCEYSKDIKQTIDRANYENLEFLAKAGDLVVEGQPQGDEIRISAKACSDNEERLADMRFEVSDKGQTLEIVTLIPRDSFYRRSNSAYIDIELTVPAELATQLADSSGNLEVKGATITQIHDSSGQIRVEEVLGDLMISDSSGDIWLRDLHGNLELSDSSGAIEIDDVQGKVTILQDSSGDIEIEQTQAVEIITDSSGDIEIEEIHGDVQIHSDSSGSIRIANIQGSVEIGSDGSGSVKVRDITGDLSLGSKGSGSVNTHNIAGSLELPNRFD